MSNGITGSLDDVKLHPNFVNGRELDFSPLLTISEGAEASEEVGDELLEGLLEAAKF